jgi:putative copper export protein
MLRSIPMLPFLNVWLHILAAVIWIGGMLFLSLIAVPVLRRIEAPLVRRDLFRAMAQRFRGLVWICIAILVLTGIGNVVYYGNTTAGSPYMTVLHIKLGLVAVLVMMGLFHDFVIGPRAVRAMSRDGLPPTGTDLLMVALAPWIGRANLLLGIVILMLAAALTRSH